jgi:hypothetical protein
MAAISTGVDLNREEMNFKYPLRVKNEYQCLESIIVKHNISSLFEASVQHFPRLTALPLCRQADLQYIDQKKPLSIKNIINPSVCLSNILHLMHQSKVQPLIRHCLIFKSTIPSKGYHFIPPK